MLFGSVANSTEIEKIGSDFQERNFREQRLHKGGPPPNDKQVYVSVMDSMGSDLANKYKFVLTYVLYRRI